MTPPNCTALLLQRVEKVSISLVGDCTRNPVGGKVDADKEEIRIGIVSRFSGRRYSVTSSRCGSSAVQTFPKAVQVHRPTDVLAELFVGGAGAPQYNCHAAVS